MTKKKYTFINLFAECVMISSVMAFQSYFSRVKVNSYELYE